MHDDLWWREGVVYQIYPRSFYDTDGDGLGDLPGITLKLDYLADLGVEAIWLSPFYPSPDKDYGYDISDHCAVDPRFGTLADIDHLITEAHQRGIKVVLDLVLNHTSDQHPWFVESRSSRQNPKRDWYIWGDVLDGNPPNNWRALFGGSAWEVEQTSQQAYMHLFVKEQPDVNWRNPDLRQAQLDVVRFWLGRGVDGFRLDVFNAYFRDKALRDNPKRFPYVSALGMRHVYEIDQPEMIPLLQELRAILDEQPGCYAVGETAFATPEKAAAYCGEDKLHAAFSFEFTGLGGIGAGRLNPEIIRRKISRRERAFRAAGAWPTTVMGNHDVPRPAGRYCRDESDEMAKMAMALLLTMRGTPFLYYGDEIGMRQLKLRREQVLDPPGKAYWPFFKGRDGCRGPMQWDSSSNGGFSSAVPWLPIHPDYIWRNVAAQVGEPDSLLNLTKRLIGLRKENPALRSGDMEFIHAGGRHVLPYTRTSHEQSVLVLLNFSGRSQGVTLTGFGGKRELLYSTFRNELVPTQSDGLRLEPYEICLLGRWSE